MSEKNIALLWDNISNEGWVEISTGDLENCNIIGGNIKLNKGISTFNFENSCRLELDINNASIEAGANATIVSVNTVKNPFSLFLRDVNIEYPIYIPQYDVIVTEKDDERSFKEIQNEIKERGLLKGLQKIKNEPEETFENAAGKTRELFCETWLGISRDMRIFSLDFERENGDRWNWIQPRYHGIKASLPQANNIPIRFNYMIGRGIGCERELNRYLDEGILPILHADIKDNDIFYSCVAFASTETSKLNEETLRGTHYIVADEYSCGRKFTKEQEELMQVKLHEEVNREEETVMYFQTKAVNTSSVPRYAWFKTAFPNGLDYSFNGENGFSLYECGKVFCITKLNGNPIPQEEVAILLKPGESAIFEFYIPHAPINESRANKLAKREFTEKLDECRNFWKSKLSKAANIELPEKRIEQMLRAGLLHIDIISYGLEPNGAVTPTVGIYSAIGSESWPIIQFMDSMGWHGLARRAIMYFIEKQHENGFMQNFNGYMLETGAVLWCIGEHYRYTRDDNWIKKIMNEIIKACNYIIEWRSKNKKEELIGKGYGMLEGQMADCPDKEMRIYMLNGFQYLGLKRISQVLQNINPEYSKNLAKEAENFKLDMRTALFESLSKGIVVPLGDGTWCPTISPWPDQNGPVCLFADERKWYTHGNFTTRDSHLPWLVFQEVIDPNEEVVDFILDYYNELFFTRNVRLSQPYYSRHPFVHLMRDEVKPFLKAYYNGFAGLADRETYTFWEHYHHASPHKTHEEACFLMESRWMLYMEEGNTLKFLRGIPRNWLESGKKIKLNGVASYFGKIFFELESRIAENYIKAELKIQDEKLTEYGMLPESKCLPECVEIRIPHPLGQRPVHVKGGEYIAERELVRIEDFKGYINIIAKY